MFKPRIILCLLLMLGLILSACGAPAATTPTASTSATESSSAPATAATPAGDSTAAPAANTNAKTTITVWDYYGESSPYKPIIAEFEQANPDITVQYEAIDWDTMLEKMNVVLTGGTPPDVATVDMTWIPKFASLGAFTDLKTLGGGQLNGVPFEKAYTPGGLEAITFEGKIIATLSDFDVYALFYRVDLFQQKGLEVPKTWDELKEVAKKLAEGDKYLYEFDADTFHGSQWIYENGGTLVSSDNTKAAFNTPEAVEAIEFYYSLLTDKVAINWTDDQGERIQGIKDGRIAMFSDGSYYMGIMKSGAPEMAGKWGVATHPYKKQPGSYLGGTGLVIPEKAANKEAGWKFIEFASRVENQVGVYTIAGAAPALTTALERPELSAPDPYFANQRPLSVFLEAQKTAQHFPYVREWADIDDAFTTAMQEISLGQKPVKQALDEAAAKVDELLVK
jgi:multiple sugar transport system substrate-binding protein